MLFRTQFLRTLSLICPVFRIGDYDDATILGIVGGSDYAVLLTGIDSPTAVPLLFSCHIQ